MSVDNRKQAETTPKLVTVEEAGRTLAMSRASVYKLMDCGDLKWLKLGRSRRILAESIIALIEKNLVGV
jgi:excisionase family DNA binding protein